MLVQFKVKGLCLAIFIELCGRFVLVLRCLHGDLILFYHAIAIDPSHSR